MWKEKIEAFLNMLARTPWVAVPVVVLLSTLILWLISIVALVIE